MLFWIPTKNEQSRNQQNIWALSFMTFPRKPWAPKMETIGDPLFGAHGSLGTITKEKASYLALSFSLTQKLDKKGRNPWKKIGTICAYYMLPAVSICFLYVPFKEALTKRIGTPKKALTKRIGTPKKAFNKKGRKAFQRPPKCPPKCPLPRALQRWSSSA